MSLEEALAQVLAGGLSVAALRGAAAEAFRTTNRRSELDAILASGKLPGDFSAADTAVVLGHLHTVRGNLDKAEALLSNHDEPWARYCYASLLLARQRFDEADAVTKGLPESAPFAYRRAEVLARIGREDEGRRLVETLTGAESETGAWLYARGYCHERAGEYREAIESYQRATRADPQSAEAWFRLGFLVDLYGSPEEEENDEAVRAYEACIDIVPLHTNAVINLGLIYEDRERYHDAAKCYEAVLRVHPNHGRARLYLTDAIAATTMFYDRDQEKKADRHSQILKIPVTDFELSVRSRNCLQKMDIETLGDLIMKTEQELLSYKNFGETSLKEIKEMLTQKGLRLGQGLEERGTEPPSGRNPLEATAPSEVLDQPIDDLKLSVRSRRCMERLEVRTVRDLINKTEVELMSAKNFGMTSLNEIKRTLTELGLGLRS